MLGLLIAAIVTVITGYLIIKKWKPQPVLMLAGIFMMLVAAYVVGKPLLTGKASTGLYTFDAIKFISQLFSTRTAGLGMTIMAAGGFANYMDKIGASKALVRICVKPLQMFNSPYLVLALAFVIGQLLNVFIPSASGLAMLLMVTMYPILRSLGVSKLAAAAVICSCSGLDLGPASGNSNLAAKNTGMDAATYFAVYQIPLGVCVTLVAGAAHMFVQKYFDKKEGLFGAETVDAIEEDKDKAPLVFAILPLLPLAFIMIFSKLCIASIKMDVVTAMLLGVFISMAFQAARTGDIPETLKSIQTFFTGMGNQFANVMTLVIAGEVFARGLTALNAINTMIDGARGAGMGGSGMTIVMTIIIIVCSIVMGSGNAPFFAFAALVPGVAAKVGVSAVSMMLPMQFAAGLARNMSPITGVVVAVCGLADVEPMALVKRTTIPMIIAILVTMVGALILY